MSQEAHDEIKNALLNVDREDLLLVAKSKKLEGVDDLSKPELIDRLLESGAGDLQDQIRNALRFELRSTASGLRNFMNDAVSAAEGKLALSIEGSITKVREYVELKLAGIGQLQLMYTLIGGAAAVLLAAGTGFSIYKSIDITQSIEQFRKAQSDERTMLVEQLSLIAVQQSYAIDNLTSDVNEVMDNLSSTIPAQRYRDMATRVHAYAEQLEKLLETNKLGGTASPSSGVAEAYQQITEDRKTLQIISIAATGSDQLANALAQRDSSTIPAFRDAENSWKTIDELPAGESSLGRHIPLLRRMRAQASYALGLISLKRHQNSNGGSMTDLTAAERNFWTAVSQDSTLARPYNGIALVYYEYYLKAKDENQESANLDRLLKLGLEQLNNVLQRDQTSRSRSVALNNKAYYMCLAASELAKSNKLEARKRLQIAEQSLKEARLQSDYHPVVFITQAQIRCLRFNLVESVGVLTEKQKNQILQDVLDSLEAAHSESFSYDSTMTRSNFFERNPEFSYLDGLGIPYRDEILNAAHLLQ